ncbi:MAG: hypothetical protein QM621_09645 [Aeromicrobium sp.]|uniref:hypothetical protein n=1 Tax=Aeromicrobium sp. TaxID=1871063 RepID=UPI0039E30162
MSAQRFFQLMTLNAVCYSLYSWLLASRLPFALNVVVTLLSGIALVLLLREAMKYDEWAEDESPR